MTLEAQRQQVIDEIAQGRLDEAERLCREVLEAPGRPGPPEFLYLLGVVKTERKHPDEALSLFERAAAAMPDRADVAYAHGVAFQAVGDTEAAVDQWHRAVSLDTGHQDACFNLAKGLDELGRVDEARAVYEQLLALNGAHLPARYNLANLHFRACDFASARNHFREMLECAPENPDAWVNLGMAEKALGRLDEAEKAYRRVLEIDPDSIEAHWNLSNLLLFQGRWAEGFAEYEWRLRRAEAPKPDWPRPVRPGDDLNGKKVLLWAEQGIGDVIQFLRYAADVAEQAATVTVYCQPALLRVVATCPGVAKAVASGETPPPFDAHAPLCSLPHLLGKTDPETSWPGPYLDAAETAALDAPPAVRRVGLVWGGNPDFAFDHLRSFEAETYLPLLGVPDTAFFSLQAGQRSAAEASPAFRDKVTDLAPTLHDFADTAAAIAALDLVITSDTSVAHLAGAMGHPTWLLLHTLADWRWLQGRSDSPWYPSLRLFRQRALGDWEPVVEDVAQALSGFDPGRA